MTQLEVLKRGSAETALEKPQTQELLFDFQARSYVHANMQECIEADKFYESHTVLTFKWNPDFNNPQRAQERASFLEEMGQKVAAALQKQKNVVCLVPGCCVTWEEFQKYFPDGSMGMDGSVEGPVCDDPVRRQSNWSHHGKHCQQKECTCELALRDFFEKNTTGFKAQDGEPKKMMFLNHIDQDNITAAAIASIVQQMTPEQIERMKTFVKLEGILDRSGGFADLRDRDKDLEDMKGVFEPIMEAKAKFGWTMQKASAEAIENCISEFFQRFKAFINGKSQPKPLALEYEDIAVMDGCKMVRTIGTEARMGLTRHAKDKNIDTYILPLPPLEPKPDAQDQSLRYLYSIKFLDSTMNVEWFCDRLNWMENLPDDALGSPLDQQYKLASEQKGGNSFGGHDDLLANHYVGSRRNEKDFGEMYSFLREQYRKERLPMAA